MTIFKTACERAGPGGMDGTPLRRRRFSSTQASMERVSRRSEIPSKGDGLAVGRDTNSLGGMGVATQCLVLAFLVGAFLGSARTFAVGSLFLTFRLAFVAAAFLGASVTSVGGAFGRGADCALATRPPRSTWLKSSPRLNYSSDGWGRAGADRTPPEGGPLFATGPAGARLTSAANRNLPLPAAHCRSGCGFLRSYSI
jgi:hypothetical protein